MAFPAWLVPAILTGVGALGNVLGGKAQTGAIDRASGINQQATNNAMDIILAMYDRGQESLSPYASAGKPALGRLEQIASRGRTPTTPAGTAQPPVNSMLSRFGSGAKTPAPSVGPVRNAMGTVNGQPVVPQEQAAKSSTRNAMLGGLAGTAGVGALLGTGAAFGPIGLGAGALAAFIASKVGKNNPYKAAASRGIDEVSRLIWGTNTPGIPPEQLTQGIVADAIHGRKTVAQAKSESNTLLNECVQGMRENGTPEDVINSSIQTQKGYLAPLKDVFARLEQKPAAA